MKTFSEIIKIWSIWLFSTGMLVVCTISFCILVEIINWIYCIVIRLTNAGKRLNRRILTHRQSPHRHTDTQATARTPIGASLSRDMSAAVWATTHTLDHTDTHTHKHTWPSVHVRFVRVENSECAGSEWVENFFLSKLSMCLHFGLLSK